RHRGGLRRRRTLRRQLTVPHRAGYLARSRFERSPGAAGARVRVLFPPAPSTPSSPWRSLMSVLRSISKWLRGRGRPAAAVRKPARPRLGLESLDARIVPSTFHVTTLADAGPGSLRAPVAGANAHAGTAPPPLPPGP